MKESFNRLIRITNWSLYPTWFRWKARRINSLSRIESLYIPHGSDERKHPRNDQRLRNWPLYPTWFRWKRWHLAFTALLEVLYIPHGSDESAKRKSQYSAVCKLYIPHGSDERSTKRFWYRKTINFISHMVQMKAEQKKISLPSSDNLYIPHGSDESFSWK